MDLLNMIFLGMESKKLKKHLTDSWFYGMIASVRVKVGHQFG